MPARRAHLEPNKLTVYHIHTCAKKAYPKQTCFLLPNQHVPVPNKHRKHTYMYQPSVKQYYSNTKQTYLYQPSIPKQAYMVTSKRTCTKQAFLITRRCSMQHACLPLAIMYICMAIPSRKVPFHKSQAAWLSNLSDDNGWWWFNRVSKVSKLIIPSMLT